MYTKQYLVSILLVFGHWSSIHPVVGGQALGSCRASRLCCTGRDSSCFVGEHRHQAPSNSILDEGRKGCYCDHGCISTGDCCYDYKDACGVVDCQLSTWGHWSACDVDCGMGTMTRERRIIRNPQNGGEECSELQQKRACHGHKCESREVTKESRESALILPSRFSNMRSANETTDIRNHLFHNYPRDPMKDNSSEYCIVFEVTMARKGCEVPRGPSRQLQPGNRICVACETAAMRQNLGYRCHGHGVDDSQTRWTSLSVPNCRGRWVRKGHHRECPCHRSGHADFIFV